MADTQNCILHKKKSVYLNEEEKQDTNSSIYKTAHICLLFQLSTTKNIPQITTYLPSNLL